MMRIAALASHAGSTLQAVIDACESGELAAEVVLVISNNSCAGALTRAHKHNINTLHISSTTHSDEVARDDAMVSALADAGADWILLAGYMKKLGPQTLSAYRSRIINTHPALLPKYGGQGFYGRKVHAAVLAAGDQETGATVHLVDAEYDSGPILSQVQVPVKKDDDIIALEERVKAAERNLIIATLAELTTGEPAAGKPAAGFPSGQPSGQKEAAG